MWNYGEEGRNNRCGGGIHLKESGDAFCSGRDAEFPASCLRGLKSRRGSKSTEGESAMRKFLWLGAFGLLAMPCLKAQEAGNIQVGAFPDYYRSSATGTNMFGVGGRFGVGILPHTMLEAEMAYDFNQEFTNGFTNANGGNISFVNTGVRTLHGFFGPRVTLRHGPAPVRGTERRIHQLHV
jgi:hypothetical protein